MSKDTRHGVVARPGRSGAPFTRTLAAAAAALTLVASAASAANWSPAGIAFSTAANAVSSLRAVTDGRGGFIAAWIDARNTPAEIYCQRVDSAGVAQWATNGVLVCGGTTGVTWLSAASDGLNGILLAWTADRPSNQRNIFIQRVSAGGTALWTANGMRADATTPSAVQTAAAICSDGSGGAVVAWVDARAANDDVYIQRVTSDSSRAWTPAGVAVATSAANERAPRLLEDSTGGAFIAWETPGAPGIVTSFQHYDATGAAVYTTAFVPATARSESAVMTRWSGGSTLAVAWSVSTTNQLHATVLDALGVSVRLTTLLQGTSSKPVGLVPQSTGGALLAYADGVRIDVVRLNASGGQSAGPVAVITGQTMGANPSIAAVSDGSDGLYIVWPSNSRVFARHVFSTAASDWNGRIALASAVTSVQSGAVAVGGTDLLAAWIDDRNSATSGTDLFAQRVSFTGVTGSYHRIVTSIASGSGVILPAEGRIYVAAGADLAVFSEGTSGHYVDHLVVGASNFPGVPNYTFHNVSGDSAFIVYCSNAPIVTTVTAVANSYRAFSVPLVLANDAPSAVFQNLMPYDVTRWRFGHWLATDSAYAEPGPALTQVLAGAGYWFLGLKDTTLSFTGLGTAQTLMTLPMLGRGSAGTGWTQFGSPFRFPLAVSQLRLTLGPDVPIADPANTLTDQQIFEWDPTLTAYVAVNVLLPGRAYWLWRQSPQALSLRFPFQWDPAALNASVPSVPAGADWTVVVSATSRARAARLTFGAAAVAAGSWNGLSSRAIPSPAADGLSLVARVTGWGADDGGYQSVFRPDGELLAWEFEASAATGLTETSFALSFTNLPAGRRVLLSEPGAGWSRDMRAGDGVAMVLSSTPRRLRLEVVAGSGVTPQPPLATTLRALGPNPFREGATLAFSLGQAGPLRWDVFDLAGRRVRSEARTLAAGEHTLVWDGRDGEGRKLAPGLYLVRWQADGTSGSARLVRAE